MRTEKIISTDKGYRVHCQRTGEYRDAHDCQKCSRYVKNSLDPVNSTIKCKEII